MTQNRTPRRGAAMVETAIVLTVLLVLVIGLIVVGFGVFRHQQAACLSCEGSRWASTRGAQYESDGDQTAATRQQIIDQAILPRAVGMNPSDLTVQVEWIDQGTGIASDWDSSPKTMRSITASGDYVTNTVRVTVTYRWSPGILLGQTDIRGVSEMPMSN